MKKQLLWSMLLLMAGFSSCQKDSFKQVNQTSVGSKDKLRVAATNPGTYSELTLLARQPGENFDTYIGNWGGVSIKMQATPTWNHDQYPNLINGVPCTGGGYTVGDLNQISTSTAGGQDFFIVGVATATFTARQLFNSDVTTYINALDSYIQSHTPSSAIPQASSYIKTTYSDGNPDPHFVQVSGKLIRITTGSHFAFASIDYPTPAPLPPASAGKLLGGIYDPNNPSVIYEVYGSSGYVTSGSPNVKSVTGTYTTTSNSQINLVNVTIARNDGTTFSFAGNTIDVS
ncbi:hypothetical protein [Mucilaginibacter sp. SJ]|uniref:hypothetical protein n=1 Tax=Mucilaginibacter sp. SJ TaxID=3029053 RepID=UPI0023A92ED7|nr:hypothetical protein [Mucilaginibacter sp. SJ]WDZ99141.1 hypothetical protein MusilaSJ_16860 [Mucilaginibacter sp. SJ]